VAACFVALTDANRVAGYYTLSATGLLLASLPSRVQTKLPRYPSVPAVLLGRLAVDRNFAGRGLGSALLADAFCRAEKSEIAAYALVATAKNGETADFYRHHGFIALPDTPLTLFLPLMTARAAARNTD